MGILAFYIVNKSGGLVFNKDFSPHAPQMSTNAHLQLASTFFGCVPNRAAASGRAPLPLSLSNAAPRLGWFALNFRRVRRMQEIANQVSTKRPVSANACGIEMLEAPTFVLQAFRTVTGALFFLTAEPHTPNLKPLLQEIYKVYSDFVMKNPFHQLDMPIRSQLFDIHLDQLIQRHARR
eukprot:COSAG04_NODE_14_length_42641_cov_31.094847_28_plen_179_part_00